MGQTLTHGIYLPDEGERNCYNGLAGNWSILDGAVGTVAEHTSQIAGKAPAVHTHTKSQITDFPAYGTTAGTICEGNDSRLSDARTPVAHTHTKSDVTDLLNSNFIPSANNSYDLGSSSYQWNNLYAKNYFYNGTAWGLDKANVWTGNNKFTDLTVSSINTIDITQSTLASATISANLPFKDNGNRYWGAIRTQIQTDRSNILKLTVSNWKTNGTQGTTDLCFSYDANLDKKAFYPTGTNTELGTSTNRWKTLNGINPGALSLPDTTREEPIDTTNWVYSYNSPNVYYPPEDGWLAVACSGSDYMQIDSNTGWGITLSKGYDGYCTGIMPVKKNKRVQIRIKETSSGSVVVRKASFYPGTGDPSFTVTPLNNS